MTLLGSILIYAGLAVCLAGLVCFAVCKNFAARLLVTSIVDSCGFLTIMLGAMLCFGVSIDALKVLLLLVVTLVIGPVTSHEIARLSRENGAGVATQQELPHEEEHL